MADEEAAGVDTSLEEFNVAIPLELNPTGRTEQDDKMSGYLEKRSKVSYVSDFCLSVAAECDFQDRTYTKDRPSGLH